MKTRFYLRGKRITKKQAAEMVGEDRLKARIKESKESFRSDPNTMNSWMDGMEIRFE
jgi:hypothetical protein